MPGKEFLVSWLTDAYGMETALYDRMSYELAKVAGHHEIEGKLQEYMDQAIRHINMLDQRIAGLGGETSALKRGGLPEFLNAMQSAWRAATEMELVKKYIGIIAAAHFEAATYKALISAARELGDDETVALCQQLLHDDEEMARWFTERLRTSIQEDMAHQQDAPQVGDSSEQQPIGGAGTLKPQHLYVVFDGERQAQQAEQTLSSMGVSAQRLQGADMAHHLRGKSAEAGKITAAVERTVKLTMGETQQAEHYAGQLEQGHIVLAVPCQDRADVDRLLPVLTQHGGHNATYLAGSTTEHLGV